MLCIVTHAAMAVQMEELEEEPSAEAIAKMSKRFDVPAGGNKKPGKSQPKHAKGSRGEKLGELFDRVDALGTKDGQANVSDAAQPSAN